MTNKGILQSSFIPLALVCALLLLTLRATLDDDLFGIAPWTAAAITACALLGFAALVVQKAGQPIKAALVFTAFLITTATIFHSEWLRTATRWHLQSYRMKSAVLAASPQGGNTLHHAEWEATGFAGCPTSRF